MWKKISISNKSGLKLAAVIEVVSWQNKQPFVLLLPGFKGYKEEETFTTLAKELLKRGLGSIRFETAGFGESEGTLEHDYRFSNYGDDTEVVYRFLKQQTFVDKNRIGVCGQSMGGLQALVFVSKHPEIKYVAAISPPNIIGQDGDLAKDAISWKQQGYMDITSSKYGLIRVPYAWLEDAQKYEGVKYADKIKCPSLYILGLKDTTVTPAQSRTIFGSANEPKKMVEIPEMDHFYKRHPEILAQVNQIVTDFIVEYLYDRSRNL
jgi:uncharacterized protein